MDAWRFLEHLRALQRPLRDRLAPLLRKHGLPASTLYMLKTVEGHPHPSDLGRELGLPAPTVSRLLKGLEADGYLIRETVPEDLRRYRFRLTPRGQALQAEAHRCIQEAVEAMLSRFTAAERAELDRLLGVLANAEGDGNGE